MRNQNRQINLDVWTPFVGVYLELHRLLFGAGPRASFSDVVLRRYPLTAQQRLAARHLIGLLDPIWPLLLALAAGLAAGFAIGNPWRLMIGLPAAALYVSLVYLITATILSLVDRLLQHKAGPTILGFGMFLLINAVVLAPRFLLPTQNRGWLEGLDRVLRLLPPGAAAFLIAGAGLKETLLAGCALAGWFLLPALVLYLLENRPPVSVPEKQGGIVWENPVDRAAGWFGPGLGPLVAKWLRSYLRSQQVCFGLVAAVPAMVGLPWVLSGRGGPEKVYLTTLALMFMLGALTAGPASTNMFGFDGKGIRRYSILPVHFVRVHRAGSLAVVLLGTVLIPPALIACLACSNIPFHGWLILMPVLSAIAGIFYSNALGLWTTVLSPFPVDPRNMFGNRAPVAVTLIQVASFQPAMASMLYLRENNTLASVRNYAWLLFAAVIVCLALYVVSLYFTGRILLARRERLISCIAGK